MVTKKQPDLIIDRGSHLFVSTNQHTGEKNLVWDWDKLLEEVRAATNIKRDIIVETEKKVKRTRKKKTD